ncbi:MAG: hypothetical protein HC888_01700 [Candidatus Competibacteraceae bacterium]|nr:hypothetical protein [Candidatus Competibacteraceae bacterium]
MKLTVEIANTPSKQAQGLMYRNHLGDDQGMLFAFDTPQKLRFWGVNTYIPLDIAFVKDSGVIESIKIIKPMSDRMVTSDGDCAFAIEANMGYFAKLQIKSGDKVDISSLTSKTADVIFVKTAQINPINPLKQPIPPPMPQPQSNMFEVQPMQPQQNLPVIDTNQLFGILEDSFDDKEDGDLVEKGIDVDVTQDGEKEIPGDPAPEVPLPEKDYPEFDNVFDAMRWAQDRKESVRIYYRTDKGRDIERDVEPHGQFSAKTTGNHILVTFDQTVGEIRAFIMDNILYYIFVGKEFEPKFVLRQ